MTKTPTPASHAVNAAPVGFMAQASIDCLREDLDVAKVFATKEGLLDYFSEAVPVALYAQPLRAAPASPAQQDAPAAVLTKPARVGGGTFGIGVDERLVIEAAQRHYEYEGARKAFTPQQLVEQERKRRELWDLVHGALDAPAAQPTRECPQQSAAPEAFLEAPDVQDESGLNTHYSRALVLECIAAALQAAPPAPQGEKVYAALPESAGDSVDFGNGNIDIDWGHPAPPGGTSLYTADQMRAFADATAALRAALTPAQEHATQLAGQGSAALSGIWWRDCSVCRPLWTDDDSVRVIAITAHDDFAGVQVHDIRARDFYAEETEVTSACTHWVYRDEIWPRAASAQAQKDARDALTLEELDQLDRAIEHFSAGEDTDVDWRLLTRAAHLGYLECERFTVPPTARAAIDAARAAQGGA